MHKAKRAIIMAAGIGKRMQPVSLHTPKPLIKVNGVRMIDTVISGLHQNGITEIYVVVGYLKEAFAELPKQYPGVVLIENPLYEICNNISSLYVAREHLEDVIILDGDQIIYNPSLNGLVTTASGVRERLTSGFLPWKMVLLHTVAEMVENMVGSCLVFRAGAKRMVPN